MLHENTGQKEKRLDELYSEYLNNQTVHELLINGLNSIEKNEYTILTKYAHWLRDVIITVENIPISVSISSCKQTNNIHYPLVYVNKAFEHMTKYKRDDIIGQNCNFLQTFKNDMENNAREEMKKTLSSGNSCKILITNYKKDGSSFRNLLSLFPIKYKHGETCYYMGIQCDVSDPNTPYNYIMLVDDLMSILPKVIDEEDNKVSSYIENMIESIGIYKEIEGSFKLHRPPTSTKRSFPHRRSSIFIRTPIHSVCESTEDEDKIKMQV